MKWILIVAALAPGSDEKGVNSVDAPNPEVFADLFLGRVSAACYRGD